MNFLASVFGRNTAGITQMWAAAQRRDVEQPLDDMYAILRALYDNNGLYDSLAALGYAFSELRLRSLRNPARRAVEFYAKTVWPGALPGALPIVDATDGVRAALGKLYHWSNWNVTKQVAVRTAAIYGDAFLKLATSGPDRGGRVFIECVSPRHVTERQVDERGYIVRARLDIPGVGKTTQTTDWSPESVKRWDHERGPAASLDELGAPDAEIPLSAWGIDFVPIVQVSHTAIGDARGVGAIEPGIEKIHEANRQASRLHGLLFRHNDVTWALEANGVDAMGRPLPPPSVGPSAFRRNANDDDVVELGGERILRLPGTSRMVPLIPSLDYTGALAILESHLSELSADMPELAFYRLMELPELSGLAMRLAMSPAIMQATEVRGNHEAGLIRAGMMGLSIGAKIGAFKNIGTYADGDFAHAFASRPIIPLSRHEAAELATAETGAGVPLVTSLRNSGWSDDALDQLNEDAETQKTREAASLASGMRASLDNMTNGRAG